jgi:transketolase
VSDYGGRYVHWGVREHGMAAAMNGMALHGGVIPYGGTFLVFTDYMPPVDPPRRADGPARRLRDDARLHRPRRGRADAPAGRASRRAARHPELCVFRPGDAVETPNAGSSRSSAATVRASSRSRARTCRRCAIDPARPRTLRPRRLRAGGGERRRPTGHLIGTGSETSIALAAQKLLAEQGVRAGVVSLPCWELFEMQTASYRRAGPRRPRIGKVAVEAALGFGWERHTAPKGAFVGMTGFGASAPAPDLYNHFGITAEAVAAAAAKLA